MIDLINKISGSSALKPQAARTASANGDTVDLGANNGYNSCVFLVLAGVITDGTHAFKLQDSPDGTTFTDVPALYVQNVGGTSFTSATAAGTVLKLGYLGNTNGGYRYVRLVSTVTSATTGGFYTSTAVLGHPALLPAA